jgi:hypothetical protein
MKMGCVTCGVKFQTALGPLNKFASCIRNLARAPACSRKAFQVQPIVFNGKTLLVASCTQEQGAPAPKTYLPAGDSYTGDGGGVRFEL